MFLTWGSVVSSYQASVERDIWSSYGSKPVQRPNYALVSVEEPKSSLRDRCEAGTDVSPDGLEALSFPDNYVNSALCWYLTR